MTNGNIASGPESHEKSPYDPERISRFQAIFQLRAALEFAEKQDIEHQAIRRAAGYVSETSYVLEEAANSSVPLNTRRIILISERRQRIDEVDRMVARFPSGGEAESPGAPYPNDVFVDLVYDPTRRSRYLLNGAGLWELSTEFDVGINTQEATIETNDLCAPAGHEAMRANPVVLHAIAAIATAYIPRPQLNNELERD